MSDTPPSVTAPLDWAPARAAAAQHRTRRLQPDPRSRRRGRRLGAAALVLWAVALVLAVVGLVTPGLAGDALALEAYAALLAYAVVALLWGSWTGRHLLRGSASSIRSALPTGTWPDVRKQLAGRSSVDPEHRDVVVELAHQQRRLCEGMAAFAGFYVVLYVGIAHSNSGWLRYSLLLLGAAFLIWGLIAGITRYRRLGHLTSADAG